MSQPPDGTQAPPTSNRAALLVADGRVEMVDRPLPMPAAGQVVIAVNKVGINGTDAALFGGGYKVQHPLVLGEDFIGTAVAIGEGVEEALLGARVVGDVIGYRVRRGPGTLTWEDGALQQFLQLPAERVHVVPQDLSDAKGVQVATLASAFGALDIATAGGLTGGGTLLIMGGGRLGTLTLRAAVKSGVRCAVLTRSKGKRDRAKDSGAELLLAPNQDRLAHTINEWAGGEGVDAVIDASGDPEVIGRALTLVRPAGVVVATAIGAGPTHVDATLLVANRINLRGSYGGPFERAIEAITQDEVQVDDFIGATFPHHSVAAAIGAAKGQSKVLVEVAG